MTNQPDTSTPESHAPEVLDNDHPGVLEARAGDPEGWFLTLRHLQDTVVGIAGSPWSEVESHPTEMVFRGEDQDFPFMRTSMDLWVDPDAQDPLEGSDNQDRRNKWYIILQKTLLALAFDSGISIPIQTSDIKHNNISADNLVLSIPRLRRMMIRLQHQGVPSNFLDWTRDLHVALYFACRESSTCDGRVWFMPLWGSLRSGVPFRKGHRHYLLFEQDQTYPRMQVQSGVSLWPYGGRVAWKEEDRVRGVIIPKAHKEPLLRYLRLGHNLESRTLFADWPGVVESLKAKTPNEIHRMWEQEGSVFDRML